MHVNILKVPHHGSANNLDDDFFERVTADHYVFSGNGEHGNPERAALAMLFRARGSAPLQIHFTYPLGEIDAARERDWRKEQAKEKNRADAGGRGAVRPDWSPANQSLTAFFARGRLRRGQRIRVTDPQRPHVIDLMTRLRY
jgi:hypothetical protein